MHIRLHIRLLAGGLIVATAVGSMVSGWALLSAQSDTTFQPEIIDFSNTPPPDSREVVDLTRETPTPVPIPESAVQPSSWPPQELRDRAIQLALNDPGTKALLRGHRYGALGVNLFTDKAGPCSAPYFLSCVVVGVYDYTIPTGIEVIVNLATDEVLNHLMAPEFQPTPSEEVLAQVAAIVAANRTFGPSARIEGGLAGLRHVVGYSEPELRDRNQCGDTSPRHWCLEVRITAGDGTRSSVVVDLVDQKIVEIYPASDTSH